MTRALDLIPRALVAILVLAHTVGAQAQTAKVGDEFQINSFTAGMQRSASVAIGPDGGFVVVWVNAYYGRIQRQRHDAAGSPLDLELQVESYTTGFQDNPAVATGPDGAFVVVWQSNGGSPGTDAAGLSVQGRRFDSEGDPVDLQFQVNTYTTSSQFLPTVAVDFDGQFVVVWASDGSYGNDASSDSIQGQRFDGAGSPIGQQFQVNSYTTDMQRSPAVATDHDGGFVVVWRSEGSDSDTSGSSVQGQRFDPTGSPIGQQFQINTYTTNGQQSPAVAARPGGGFVVVWESDVSGGNDNSFQSIQARRYDAAGLPVETELQVNAYTTNGQRFPAVTADPDGDFVVVWSSDGAAGSNGVDTSFYSVQGQRFDGAGDTIGTQFQVNTYTTYSQFFPAVATDADGDFVVVWESYGSSGTDDSDSSVQRQRYRVTGDVGDRVWRDLDLDGRQDPGEPGIAGVTVHLFDSFDELRRSTTSGADGLFRFEPKPGDYFLQFEPPRELSFTLADLPGDDTVDSDADVLTGETDTFSVTLLGSDPTWDAGLGNGLGDRVWLDQDADGLQDAGEPGIAGIVVSLYDELGGLLAVTATDLEGFYSFQDLDPDRYAIGVAVPVGATVAPRDAADDGADSDVDPDTALTPLIDLARGAIDTSWDAGLIASPDQLPLLFADGFESGDTSAWDGMAPDL
jgi:hypothetical protein